MDERLVCNALVLGHLKAALPDETHHSAEAPVAKCERFHDRLDLNCSGQTVRELASLGVGFGINFSQIAQEHPTVVPDGRIEIEVGDKGDAIGDIARHRFRDTAQLLLQICALGDLERLHLNRDAGAVFERDPKIEDFFSQTPVGSNIGNRRKLLLNFEHVGHAGESAEGMTL